MMKILNEKDIRALLTGAAFYGAGGGGSLATALAMLDAACAKNGGFSVKLANAADLSADGNAVAMTGMHTAQSLAAKEVKFVNEAASAITAIQQSAFMAGKRIEGVFPMEPGAVSVMVALLGCHAAALPLMDADGCGRGVPNIDATLLEKGGIPFSPAVLSDDRDNVIRVFPYQAADAKAAENMCHYLAAAFGNVAALAAWITSSGEIEAKLSCGSISKAIALGSLLMDAGSGEAAAAALEKSLPVKLLAAGTVSEKTDLSVCLTCTDGTAVCADTAVVTTRLRCGDAVLATCPELICALDAKTGLPVSNDDIQVGMDVRYYALCAGDAWADFTACWQRYL